MHREPKLAPAIIAELLEVIQNALLVIDSKNTIIFANSRTEKMFNTTTDILLGEPFSTLFMENDQEILVPNILTLTRNDGEVESEAMFQKYDGSTFLGRISGTRFEWNTTHEGIVFSIHDITDMKEIEQTLKHSERIAFLGRLIDDISHQIRNPIVSIGGFARRLQSEHDTSRDAEIILQEASRLERLLDTLNLFANMPGPIPRKISLNELVDELNSTIGAKVKTLGCQWSCRCSKKLHEEQLLIDKNLFLKAVLNVAENSCQAYLQMDKKADKMVRCDIQPGSSDEYPFLFTIRDFGTGIAKEVQERVFSHFYTEKTGHIGMGLTFARRIIEEQGGKLTLASKPGHGTTISFHVVRERRRSLRTELIPQLPNVQDYTDTQK